MEQERSSMHASPVVRAEAADLSTAHLAHELNSRLDGSMRAIRLVIRDLAGEGESQVLRGRLESAEAVMHEMAAMLERAMRGGGPERSSRFACSGLAFATGRRLGEETEYVIALLRERAAESGIRITLDMPSEAAARPAGPLGTIVLNALRNAIEALEREAVTPGHRREPGQIDIIARERGGWLRLFVADNGPGLPASDEGCDAPEDEVSPGHTSSGHGLGLAICAQVAASIGGRVELMQPPHGPGVVLSAEIPVDRLGTA